MKEDSQLCKKGGKYDWDGENVNQSTPSARRAEVKVELCSGVRE